MKYDAGAKRMAAYRDEIAAIRKKMRAALAETEAQEVEDYAFETANGPMHLSELFGEHKDLLVVHNMGAACPACTMWADGYNGVHHHIVTRTAFVVSSPDAPAAQKKFAEGRGWKFPMISHQGTTFAADMGYRSPEGKWRPGISAFKGEGKKILRVSDTELGPGDDFCSVWHMFDLLPEGAAGWRPKFQYP
ncbi:MAG: DUF899 domain-containing protein [Rhodospirillaceae bacterium]|nr:MAG: DUF899 domain-containing protein [Rhodospirillaceae bacterium]